MPPSLCQRVWTWTVSYRSPLTFSHFLNVLGTLGWRGAPDPWPLFPEAQASWRVLALAEVTGTHFAPEASPRRPGEEALAAPPFLPPGCHEDGAVLVPRCALEAPVMLSASLPPGTPCASSVSLPSHGHSVPSTRQQVPRLDLLT